MKKKNMLRMGVIISIAIFILMPLLSSPVAATFVSIHYADTDNTPAGPTATITPPTTTEIKHSGASYANFQCNYHFKDTNPGGGGSWYYTYMKVQKIDPYDENYQEKQFGPENIGPSGSDIIGELIIQDTYSGTTTWRVWATLYCEDILTSVRSNDAKQWDIIVSTD